MAIRRLVRTSFRSKPGQISSFSPTTYYLPPTTYYKRWLLLVFITCLLLLGLHFWGNLAAIATAPQPPSLSPAKLGGKPVYVLYLTRSGDKVLVRCYPGQTPTLTVKDMTGQPGVKEGTLVCS